MRADKQPFMAAIAIGSVEARYYDNEFCLIMFTSKRKDGVPRKAYIDIKRTVEIQNEAAKILKVATIVPYKLMSGPIIEEIDDDWLLSKGKGSNCSCHIKKENTIDFGRK